MICIKHPLIIVAHEKRECFNIRTTPPYPQNSCPDTHGKSGVRATATL